MIDMLKTQADYSAIQVVYNSLTTSKAERTTIRKQLLPSCGYLYPDCYKQLVDAESIEALRDVVKGVTAYKRVLGETSDPTKAEDINVNTKTLDDLIFEEKAERNKLTFDEQANMGAFYSYIQLKEQEMKNINWMAELVARKKEKNDPSWKKIIYPFPNEM